MSTRIIFILMCLGFSLNASEKANEKATCADVKCTQVHEEKTTCTDATCTDATCTEDHTKSNDTCNDPECNDYEEEPCTDTACKDDHDNKAETKPCADATCKDDHAIPSKKEQSPIISTEALQNYKVTFAALKEANYTQTINIPAKIQRQSQATTEWVMKMPGRITNIQSLRIGTLLDRSKTQELLTIIRDPISLPNLEFVSPILKPTPSELQSMLNELQKCKVTLNNLNREYTRLNTLDKSSKAGSLLPRQTLIDLELQIQSQTEEFQNDLSMLMRFGFTIEELKAKTVVLLRQGPEHYLRALKRQGYWNNHSNAVYQSLNSENQNNYWVIASLGEMVAKHYLNEKVASALINNEQMRFHLVDTLSLLLSGMPISNMITLANEGWLHPIVQLKLPEEYNFYTLEALNVKVGGYYPQGATIATLCDQSQVELTCRPLGTERALFTQAAQLDLPLTARPLLKNGGPFLDSLRIDRFEQDAEGEKVIITVPNTLLNNSFYQLREQMDYVVQLPTEKEFKNIFIVPLDAVVDLGSDKVIILKQGENYVQAKVIILYQDGVNAILSSKSQFHKGNIYAKTGAFRLNLAIQKAGGQQTFDAHAGCSH